jgi:transposase
MTKSNVKVHSERVDDIPIIIELAKILKIDKVVEKWMPSHGHQKGLSNGELTLGWIAYILSEGDHCKVGVNDWAAKLQYTLNGLLQRKIRSSDFNDDRLARLLRRFSKNLVWENIEKSLWLATVDVYEFSSIKIRVDSTASYGYHEITENGVMQLGSSKDYRPDLPQLKIMAAVVEGCGYFIGSDVVPGNRADDILYTPLIKRVRDILGGEKSLLYTGDSKMAAFNIRADIAINEDYYFVPLPQIKPHGPNLKKWSAEVTEGERSPELIYDGKEIIAAGFEIQKTLSHEGTSWEERTLIIRSFSYAKLQIETLDRHLKTAEKQIKLLTPPIGRGARQISCAEVLKKRINQILNEYGLKGLLHIESHRTQKKVKKYVGKGRSGAKREFVMVSKIRYSITAVQRDEKQIARKKCSLGWRAFATNVPLKLLSLSQGVLHYRQGWTVEREFHILKGHPLGIRPFFVKNDDQLIGLTRFLTLGLRLLTFMEMAVRDNLNIKTNGLLGLYKGQAKRFVKNPTAQQMLEAISRHQVTLTKVDLGSSIHWHMSDFPQHFKEILRSLKIPESVYETQHYSKIDEIST